MKLYKLFENIILGETNEPLTGNVSDEDVIKAIEGKYYVNITYDDYPDKTPSVTPSKRYIQVYNFSDTTANNKAIRAYQVGGGSKTTPGRGAWKIFRLDRIRSWQPTKMRFYKPIDKFNPDGDRTMRTVHNIANFDDKYKTTTYKRKSTDITPDYIANMSPEAKEKYVNSLKKSEDKYRVAKNVTPKKNNPAYIKPDDKDKKQKDLTNIKPTEVKPQSSYIVNNDNNDDNELDKENLKKRIQQKLVNKNNKDLKTNNDDDTTTSRP
jgi:hypothetical protein